MLRRIVLAVTLGAILPAIAMAADPTTAELLERMSAYEERVRQLEQRVERAEQRAAAAEAALAGATSAPAAPAAVAAAPPAGPATVSRKPEVVRHFKDRSSVPHGEGDGKFPNSWPVPGTDSYLAIGGYLKADYLQDVDYIGNANQFAVASIPVDGTAEADLGGQSTLTARETRLNLDFHKPSALGDIRAFAEGDFAGSGNGFRLRHAYGQIGGFLAGQTWTTFADTSTHPYTLDFEGADATIWRRQAMLRYTGQLAPGWTWAIAIEEPGTSISNAGGVAGADRSDFPDVPGFIRYQAPTGSIQFGAIYRQLRFDGDGADAGVNDTDAGYGVALSFTRSLFGGDVLSGQFVYGDGVANYIQGLSGQGVDAVLTPDGTVRALTASSGMLAYTHRWSAAWRSVLAVSTSQVDDEAGLPGTAIERLDDVHLNLLWSPFKAFEVGAEAMWGQRTDQNGQDGDATRFQFSAKYYLD
jgi:hypothetical protein